MIVYKTKTIYETLSECYLDACAHEILHCIVMKEFYNKHPEKQVYTEGRCKDLFIQNFMDAALCEGRVKEYPNYNFKEN